jgi:hypothetical protein
LETGSYDRAVRVILRSAIGLAIAAGGLTFLTYGIAQAVQTGSCGSSSSGVSYGPACPSGFGPMIVLMVFGTFLAIGGAAIAGRLASFIGALVAAVIVGVVLGFVDLNDADTRPGPEILVAVLAPMMLFVVPGVGRTRRATVATPQQRPQPADREPDPEMRPQWSQPPTTKMAEDLASRLRQLEQLKASGLLADSEYAERRRQILSEL